MRASRFGHVRGVRLLLAYLLALQALLGAWSSVAQASSFDPALSLCRSMAQGSGAQDQSEPAGGTPERSSHCQLMCLSGGCGSPQPPVAIVSVFACPALHARGVPFDMVAQVRIPVATGVAWNARGPPFAG
jgi:hypothetical protein